MCDVSTCRLKLDSKLDFGSFGADKVHVFCTWNRFDYRRQSEFICVSHQYTEFGDMREWWVDDEP